MFHLAFVQKKKYWTTQHANTKLLFFGRVKHHQRKKNRKEKKGTEKSS